MELSRIAKINNIKFHPIEIRSELGIITFKNDIIQAGQYIDRIGILEGKFNIKGRLANADDLEELQKIINNQLICKLSLPTTNQKVLNVISTERLKTLIFDDSAVGRYVFDITLEISSIKTKIEDNLLLQNNSFFKNNTLIKLANTVQNTYKVVNSTVKNATDFVYSLANDLAIIRQAIPNALLTAGNLSQSIIALQGSATDIIRLPNEINAIISNIINDFIQIGETQAMQIELIKELLNISSVSNYDNSCSYLEDKSNTIYPLELSKYTNCIIELTDIATNNDYNNVDEIQIEIDYLYQQKEYLKSKIIDINLLFALNSYIDNSILILKDKISQLPVLYQFKFENMNDYAVYYWYYGNIDIDNINKFRIYNQINQYGIVNENIKFYQK